MLDPERTYVDTSVRLAADVTLFPGTLLQGDTYIATGCEIGPNSHLVDCVVGERATVSNSVARSAEIGVERRHVVENADLDRCLLAIGRRGYRGRR